MSSKKANNFTPANLDDLANQLFDKTKQMSLSIKDQRKLLKEYLSAKIEGSDESEKEEESDTDSYSESDSDSENDSYSDSEDDSDTEFDEETEESSEESNSLDDDREITKPTKAVTQMSEKNLAASLVDKKKGNEISTREHKHSKSLETKLVSLSQPTSRIQHRTTMAGGLVAAPIRNSLPFNKEVKLPSKSEIKSCQIANKVTLSPRAEDQKPLNKPSVNLKAGDFSKEIKQTTIKLADPRS
ncbi:bifunctional lysine-specific demethylase and histidyl-hydroxylase NO66 [Drosophila elegans]|uniref:bifunctional lysine-specific demethylase and histidyl-hydroxylase NO66 n=1 Tax=Drosophila elegans TaxID=30023 RepID=UPI0007E89D51|nr:bifunctional lysine-specific demethylase and histidyl-hydroxylase NO66 [Drosophila elegans]